MATPLSAEIALARAHVAKGRQIVAKQRALIARIRAVEGDDAGARQLLVTFEKTLAIFEEDLASLVERARV